MSRQTNVWSPESSMKIESLSPQSIDIKEETCETDSSTELTSNTFDQKYSDCFDNIKVEPTNANDFLTNEDRELLIITNRQAKEEPREFLKLGCNYHGKSCKIVSNTIDLNKNDCSPVVVYCPLCDTVVNKNLPGVRGHGKYCPENYRSERQWLKTDEEEDEEKESTSSSMNSTRFACDRCSYKTNTTSDIRKHVIIHDGIKPYRCDVCRKSYARRSYLTQHRLKHSGETRSECDHCGMKFSVKGDLARHIKRKHLHLQKARDPREKGDEKRFWCPRCPYRSNYSSTFKRHCETHEGIRRFECYICNKRFARKDDLRVHVSVHTGEKRWQCDVCDRRCSARSNLKKHRLVHTRNAGGADAGGTQTSVQ